MKYHSFFRFYIFCVVTLLYVAAQAQIIPTDSLYYSVSMQSSLSTKQTPFWLHSNYQGLSSLRSTNAYLRTSLIHPFTTNNKKHWDISYGIDIAACSGHTSHFVIHQAFASTRYKQCILTLGAKENTPMLINPNLSSGALAFGTNARPIPSLRFSTNGFRPIPFTKGWVSGYTFIDYGMPTDQRWQQDFTLNKPHEDDFSHYVKKSYIHRKAGYLKIGDYKQNYPWSIIVGLEMGTQFGGNTYYPAYNKRLHNSTKIKDFIHALIPSGGDTPDKGTVYENASGNHLGAWIFGFTRKWKKNHIKLYAEKYFEDHSALFLLDYDGYGTGKEWDKHKKSRFLFYSPRDIMVGMQLHLDNIPLCHTFVLEYLYQKYQSGPIYHDHNPSLPDHIGGNDNYYNHYIYNGWQHWGEVIGNPFFLSPIYNHDGQIMVKNNRFKALHIGCQGQISSKLSYKMLLSMQDGLGTYEHPYHKIRYGYYGLSEITWRFNPCWLLRSSFGFNAGNLRNVSQGINLTLTYTNIFQRH